MKTNVDNPFQSPIILSLCTGMRGLERGIERAIRPLWRDRGYKNCQGESSENNSVRVAAYVEIETFVIENLVKQMEQGVLAPTPVWSNLKTFSWSNFHEKVHGIIGGYPCQPFSVAGNRKGEDDPRHLWPYIKEGIRAIKPVWCFFENVPGHLTLGYRQVREDLQELGYAVKEGIFSAEEVGAPHQRKRLFILAVENIYCKSMWGYFSGIHGEATPAGSEVEHPKHIGWNSPENRESVREGKDCYETREENAEQFGGSGFMANSHADEPRTGFREIQSASKKIERAKQREEWDKTNREWLRPESRDGSKNLADPEIKLCEQPWYPRQWGSGFTNCSEFGNTDNARLEGRDSRFCEKCTSEWVIGSHEPCDRWPARPNENQYEWEPPRVESSMGYVFNGYNFREDLLRMAGNGVVEQTAELAFKMLIEKHINQASQVER